MRRRRRAPERRPSAHTADAVGTAVNAGTMTSSPGPTPSAAKTSCERARAAADADDLARAGRRREAPRRARARAPSARGRAARCRSRGRAPSPRRTRPRSGGGAASGRRRGPRAIDVVADGGVDAVGERRSRGDQPRTRLALEKSPWKLPMSMRSRSSGPRHAAARPRSSPAARWVRSAISARVSESSWPRLKISPTASGVVADSEQGVDDVVDVHAVAALGAVAVQHDLLAEQGPADEHRQEPEVLALEVLARARTRWSAAARVTAGRSGSPYSRWNCSHASLSMPLTSTGAVGCSSSTGR